MNKILDNLNKYIKDDLVNWVTSNVNHKIEFIGDFVIYTEGDLSEFFEFKLSFGVLLNDKLVTCYVKYDNRYKKYFLYIQNIPLNIRLRFIYSIDNEKELFRIINLFSECFLNGHYIHDESYFYGGEREDD